MCRERNADATSLVSAPLHKEPTCRDAACRVSSYKSAPTRRQQVPTETGQAPSVLMISAGGAYPIQVQLLCGDAGQERDFAAAQ